MTTPSYTAWSPAFPSPPFALLTVTAFPPPSLLPWFYGREMVCRHHHYHHHHRRYTHNIAGRCIKVDESALTRLLCVD
ncbi:hypothetical protein E2C01_072006 [Portunus trituberculatus]|uniref:Uncharacterized protein n=1 Tax=Portunus trituberculatus TaxID=210409 RepID=A0A5B7I6M0_PORTR|nr:hypothetical protein [Portunus trituberculatus]